MRTTIRIDEELLSALREQAHQEGIPLTGIVNRTLRRGLSSPRRPGPRRRPPQPESFKMGTPLIPLDKALAVAGLQEDQEVLRKLGMRK